jgi:CAAX protease family protein
MFDSFWQQGSKRNKALPKNLNVPWTLTDALVLVVMALIVRAAVMFALTQVASYSPSAAYWLDLLDHGNLIASLLLDGFDLALSVLVVLWYLARYHVSMEAIGWRRVPLDQAALCLVVAFVAFRIGSSLVLDGLGAIIPHFNPSQMQQDYFIGIAPTHRVAGLVTLVLVPPLFEETVFRGFLFPAIAKRWGVAWGAVLSSAIFGVAHFQVNLGIYTFMLGLVLCVMYVRLKSIVPGMVLHMLNNYLAFIALTHK